MPNEYSQLWLSQMLWGVVYMRNQELYEPRLVRLVPIASVQPGSQ